MYRYLSDLVIIVGGVKVDEKDLHTLPDHAIKSAIKKKTIKKIKTKNTNNDN